MAAVGRALHSPADMLAQLRAQLLLDAAPGERWRSIHVVVVDGEVLQLGVALVAVDTDTATGGATNSCRSHMAANTTGYINRAVYGKLKCLVYT